MNKHAGGRRKVSEAHLSRAIRQREQRGEFEDFERIDLSKQIDDQEDRERAERLLIKLGTAQKYDRLLEKDLIGEERTMTQEQATTIIAKYKPNPHAKALCEVRTHCGEPVIDDEPTLSHNAAVALGKLGGKVKSERKRIATAKSLEKARAVKAAKKHLVTPQ